jgi:hypothetical protein
MQPWKLLCGGSFKIIVVYLIIIFIMKEMLVKIPEESTEFVTELLQKLGVHLEDTSNKKIKKNKNSVSPTYLFGKWKDLDLNAKTLRKNLWQRQNKF